MYFKITLKDLNIEAYIVYTFETKPRASIFLQLVFYL